MFEAVKNLLRNRALKKYSSTLESSMLPLESIRSAAALIDVREASFDNCKEALNAFFRERGIKGEIFFLDLRKIDSEERLLTSIKNTILRKDLSWYGRPSKEKIALLSGLEPDLFLCLTDSEEFVCEFAASCIRARFKVGRKQFPGKAFDMVISPPAGTSLSQKDIFLNMKEFLLKIR